MSIIVNLTQERKLQIPFSPRTKKDEIFVLFVSMKEKSCLATKENKCAENLKLYPHCHISKSGFSPGSENLRTPPATVAADSRVLLQ